MISLPMLPRSSTPQALALLLLVSSISACGINNIPTYDEAVNTVWHELQVLYTQREDLTPQLITDMQAKAEPHNDQLPDLLAELATTRSRVIAIDISPDMLSDEDAFEQFQSRQMAMDLALAQVLAVLDGSEKLQADENLASLRDQFRAIDGRVSAARADYVEVVRRYNRELRTVPGRWWHSLMYSEMREKATVAIDRTDVDTTSASTSD